MKFLQGGELRLLEQSVVEPAEGHASLQLLVESGEDERGLEQKAREEAEEQYARVVSSQLGHEDVLLVLVDTKVHVALRRLHAAVNK